MHVLVRPGRATGLPAGVTVHEGDLLDAERMKQVVARVRPRCVFHLAGQVDLERSALVARACIEDNVTGTLNLVEALREAPVQRFVYTSSTEVYGSSPTPAREGGR